MEQDKERLEKVEPEPISPEQAQQEQHELQQAARQAASGSEQEDELADVETIPREQAEKEIREAARKVKEEGQ